MAVEQDMPTGSALDTEHRPLIGITMGDPAGIGAELIARALDDAELRQQGRFVIYGLHEALCYAADRYEISPFWFRRPHEHVRRVETGVVVADFDEFGLFPSPVRQPTEQGGQASFRFLCEAVERSRAGMLDGIVTAPLSLESWQHAGIRFKSVMAMLSDAFRVRRVTKMLIGGPLRVALASDREPLFSLWHRFAIGLVFHPIDRLNETLHDCFGIEQPRIGVCGLNPPDVEEGRFGDEERRVIDPAIVMAREAGIRVEGPVPAVEIFAPRNGHGYDGIVALYHDQGAVAVRMMAPEGSVMATLGIPTIHLMPQTGPSFEWVGRDRVSVEPMKRAIRLACEMARHRKAMQVGAASG
ncbi:MAG: 4-hydroxythreonine-4-phosphate dehydrogenase PdxA [Phycisphaerae bacterium]|nr:4-hydroxythreonine-4-phosphate dehydrogenase PdxA [Phycisphaerae bacterium]